MLGLIMYRLYFIWLTVVNLSILKNHNLTLLPLFCYSKFTSFKNFRKLLNLQYSVELQILNNTLCFNERNYPF